MKLIIEKCIVDNVTINDIDECGKLISDSEMGIWYISPPPAIGSCKSCVRYRFIGKGVVFKCCKSSKHVVKIPTIKKFLWLFKKSTVEYITVCKNWRGL